MAATTALIATADTADGFGIGIIRRRNGLAVIRMDDQSQYVVLSAHTTEDEARAAANREWLADMGR